MVRLARLPRCTFGMRARTWGPAFIFYARTHVGTRSGGVLGRGVAGAVVSNEWARRPTMRGCGCAHLSGYVQQQYSTGLDGSTSKVLTITILYVNPQWTTCCLALRCFPSSLVSCQATFVGGRPAFFRCAFLRAPILLFLCLSTGYLHTLNVKARESQGIRPPGCCEAPPLPPQESPLGGARCTAVTL